MAKGFEWRFVNSMMRAYFPPYQQALETNAALKAENARLQQRVEELERMRLRINVSRDNSNWEIDPALLSFPLCGEGAYSNDPLYPRGAMAFTDDAMRRMISEAGLRLTKPYLRGSWSGLYDKCDDGQDVAVLGVP